MQINESETQLFFCIIYLLCVCGCGHSIAHMWRWEDTCGSWFYPSTMWAPGTELRVGGKYLYPHLTGPQSFAMGLRHSSGRTLALREAPSSIPNTTKSKDKTPFFFFFLFCIWPLSHWHSSCSWNSRKTHFFPILLHWYLFPTAYLPGSKFLLRLKLQRVFTLLFPSMNTQYSSYSPARTTI